MLTTYLIALVTGGVLIAVSLILGDSDREGHGVTEADLSFDLEDVADVDALDVLFAWFPRRTRAVPSSLPFAARRCRPQLRVNRP